MQLLHLQLHRLDIMSMAIYILSGYMDAANCKDIIVIVYKTILRHLAYFNFYCYFGWVSWKILPPLDF